jgi:hypothetical protein
MAAVAHGMPLDQAANAFPELAQLTRQISAYGKQDITYAIARPDDGAPAPAEIHLLKPAQVATLGLGARLDGAPWHEDPPGWLASLPGLGQHRR